MTKKEFKAAMCRGMGRCVSAVQQEPEKYRALVLWACQGDFAYDPQCEGTRAWYAYTLASCYPDKEPFIQAAAEALQKQRSNGSWDLLHLTELLMLFSQDGYECAHRAVKEKYQALLSCIRSRRRRPLPVFHELWDLEQLGLNLALDRSAVLRIAGDFGSLYREKHDMLDGDFEWFFETKGTQYRRTMEKAAKKNPNIVCFLQREQASAAAREQNRGTIPPKTGALPQEPDPDVKHLETHLREAIAAKDWDEVHAVGFEILRSFREGSKIPRPKHLLPLLYEYTPCACCRENVVRKMAKHRMLTKELLEECLYDSSDSIRSYASKRL